MIVAVIPARGGSKRVPGKNLREMCGRPAIAWPIAAALGAGVFDKVVVSTEDRNIAEVARAAGAAVPAMRPAELADDHTPLDAVMRHAIDTLDVDAEWVCMIYATAVLLQPPLLRSSADLLAGDIDYLLGVVRYGHPIQRALRFEGDRIVMQDAAAATVRTQDLPPRFHDAAQFVFGRSAAWREARPVWGENTAAIEIPANAAVDIDEEEDFLLAEALLQINRQ